jgi:hypothetical protein
MSTEKKEPKPEAVMDAFRLARSGNYRTARQLKQAFAEMYPDMTPAETAAVFAKLAMLVCK